VNEANSLGRPVCCCCDHTIMSTLPEPPKDTENGVSAALSMQLAAESMAAQYATCVNGHQMHAICFSRLITAALPCPSCNEPLIAPPVAHLGGGDEDCCACGGNGRQDPDNNAVEDVQLNTRLDYMAMSGLCFDDEDEFGRPSEGTEDGVSGGRDGLDDLRQCPGCSLGPVFNTDCDDLNHHHGECQKCGARVLSPIDTEKVVAERLAVQRSEGRVAISELDSDNSDKELSVVEALPDCKVCLSQGIASKVWYNGCMGCGMSFASIPWGSLPPYEPPLEMYGDSSTSKVRIPRRRTYIDRVRRERRAVRLVAALEEQLQDELVLLLHEKQAIVDEQRRSASR